MPANEYRACDKQFMETVVEYTVDTFSQINQYIEMDRSDGFYSIIQQVDDIVERFPGFFPENNRGVPINIYTLPPKVILHCVCDHMSEIVWYETEMMQYGFQHNEIHLLQKYHFRLLSHSLEIFNRICQRFIANNYQPIKTRNASTRDVVLVRKEYHQLYKQLRSIVEHLHNVYAITFPIILTSDFEMPVIDSLIMQLESYEFLQEPTTTTTPNPPVDERERERERMHALQYEQEQELSMDIEDTDAETATDLGD